MNKVRLINQHDEKDCGAASLSMILEAHGRKVSMPSVREAIQVDQHGASICGLMEGAEQNGLNAQPFRLDADDLWDNLKDGSLPVPAILRVVSHGIFEHYVVVDKLYGDRLHLLDPDVGKRLVTLQEFREIFLGQVITFSEGNTFQRDNLRKGRFSRYMTMLLHQKRLLFVIAVLSLGITGIGLAGSFLFQYLIDHVLGNLNDVTALDEGLDYFAVLITALAILYLFKMAVQMLRGKLLTMMSKNIDLPLMLGYYDHVAELPMKYFDTRKTGEIMSRFSDASKIREAISGAALTLMIDTVMVAVCSVILYRTSHVLFTIAVSTFLLYLLVAALYLKPLDRFNRKAMEQSAEFSSYLKESIDGIETVKTAKAVTWIKGKAHHLFQTFIETNIRGSMLSIGKDALIEWITSMATLVLLWVGAVSVVQGEMTIGALVTFVTLLGYFLSPIQNLVDLQSNLQTAYVAADRLNDAMELEQEHTGTIVPDQPLHSVAMKGVDFRYGTRQLTLKNMTFSAQTGQQIAMVGESGCGKSTSAKLVQGLYRSEAGEVTMNGIPIQNLSLEWIRSQIACVAQNTFLFSDTVRNNLLLGIPEQELPDDDEITRVLDACACDFVKELPMGLDSPLEENGANLSGGQRQRLAIARALLRKPRMLILDEATSALDSLSEQSIQSAIRSLCPEMIVLIIAHRLSTVKHCDEIMVLSHGKVIERGTHNDLLQKHQRYEELWNCQNAA